MKWNQKVNVMTIKYLLSGLFIVFLFGCASEPNKIQYYELMSSNLANNSIDNNTDTQTSKISQKPLIVLEAIKFSDFLKRQGIVIQSEKYKLQISNYHRWAENIESSSSRIVLSQLEKNLENYRFENHNGRWKVTPSYKINIEFYQFQIVQNKNTITSGYFWIFDGENNLLEKQSFSYELPLEKKGYEYAISLLEKSLISMTKKISKMIDGPLAATH